jgi:hypothetical protein|tara:strand:- start:7494 stop:8987 length:1494 start_codon:yes stop_codon:yes gene_type:complete
LKKRQKVSAGIVVTRWLLVPLLVLSLGLLIISNLILQTRVVRNWFEQKLERRSECEWNIGSLSWTPWTGIQVRDVTAELSNQEVGMTVRSLCRADVDVQFYWDALPKGMFELREVRVRRGTIAIPMELLALLPGKEAPEKDPPVSPERPPEPKGEKSEAGPKLEGKKPGNQSARGNDPAPGPAGRPFMVILDHCEIGVYSNKGKGKGGFVLHNLRGELPLKGEDASGWIECDGVTLGGRVLSGAWRNLVEWHRPFLRLAPTEFEWEGLSVRSEGSFRMRGTPRFLVSIETPAGPIRMNRVPMAPWSEMGVEAARVHMQGSLGGTLTALNSWRGDLEVEASDLDLTHAVWGDKVAFEHGKLTASMRGGTFQVIDGRLHSEQLSFLGNGMIVPDGRVRGVLRVVSDSDRAAAITRFAVGAMLTGGWTRSWLAPLVTSDRHYRDFQLKGTLDRAVIDVGRKGEDMEVSQIWNRMIAFVENETEETERDVAPTRQDQFLSQ